MRDSAPVQEHPGRSGYSRGRREHTQGKDEPPNSSCHHPPHRGPNPPRAVQTGEGEMEVSLSPLCPPDLQQGSRPSVRPSVLHCQRQPPSVKITSRGGREQKPGWEGNKIQVSSSSSSENVSSWHERGVSKPSTSLTSAQWLSPWDLQLIHSASI